MAPVWNLLFEGLYPIQSPSSKGVGRFQKKSRLCMCLFVWLIQYKSGGESTRDFNPFLACIYNNNIY